MNTNTNTTTAPIITFTDTADTVQVRISPYSIDGGSYYMVVLFDLGSGDSVRRYFFREYDKAEAFANHNISLINRAAATA